jgi:hypothetical protein
MPAETVVVQHIEPLIWPDCYLVTGSRNTVVVGHHNGRWTCGSSPDEILRGRGTVIDVIDGEKDLLAVSRTALSLSAQPAAATEIRETQLKARDYRAAAWEALIKRGASGEGPRGTESTGEYLIVVAADQMLASGDPALTILDRYSLEELIDIRAAMKKMGHEGWYYPVISRQRK